MYLDYKLIVEFTMLQEKLYNNNYIVDIKSSNDDTNIIKTFRKLNNKEDDAYSDYKTVYNENSNDNTETNVNPKINIFRYNFNNNVIEYLLTFAKIHQHDERKSYNEAWKMWLEENMEIVKGEEKRLQELGYNGNVIHKMYKATRYYFRKKPNIKSDPKNRRKYVSMEHEILTAMDNHIIRNMTNVDYTPSSGYLNFCQLHVDLIKSEISRMLEINISKEEIGLKFKKTYKNRYFILSRLNFNN